jgi:endoglucanase
MFYLKKSIVSVLLLVLHICVYAQVANVIQLNQLGFYSSAPKIAVLTAPTNATKFHVVNLASKDTVYTGSLSETIQSKYSSTQTHIADFSAYTKPGNYIIQVDTLAPSYPFSIGFNSNHSAAVGLLKGYYFIRSSIPLEKKYAGKWARPAGHPDTAVLIHSSAASQQRPEGTIISTPGGWYDAGDYNKYVVNSGISTGTLLSSYEDFHAYFDTLKDNIPESNNKLPDVLDEALYNIRWMLTMQDPNDGGVYNKCTNAAFDAMVMPGVTKLPRYVVQKGTAATLDFAAVMAQAARITKHFKKELPGFSDSCLHAAEFAWQWALNNPSLAYNQDANNRKYKPVITTGGYGDFRFTDEWFWAASELLSTTQDQQYVAEVQKGMQQKFTLASWGDVEALGCYSLLRNKQSLKHITALNFTAIGDSVVRFADSLLNNGGNKAFATIMGQSKRDFIWGSSAVAANQGVALINAYLLTKNKKYVDAALTNLDYLFGRNATGYCFVTGFGSKPTMNPHHRPSVADGILDPVPGLLAGGPNPGRQDHAIYKFTEPETAYSDTDAAYASNEIAINWNAPAVYLANAIEALQYAVGYSK